MAKKWEQQIQDNHKKFLEMKKELDREARRDDDARAAAAAAARAARQRGN